MIQDSKTCFALNLTPADLAMFSKFGVTADVLQRARIQRVTDAEAREKFGITSPGDMGGIAFPYFSPMEGARRTCRVRRDHPEIESGKPRKKYISAYGDRRHLYFVPGCKELVSDSNVPVVLVEGEKSALAVSAWADRAARKLLPLAMGGCWGWRGRIGKAQSADGELVDELGPLPELLRVCTADRKVYVLLDANCATNPNVRKARASLASVLHKLRADVQVLDLPAADGVNGPDDYIAVKGDFALARIFDGADEGVRTLDNIKAFLHRFVVISDSQATAIALWVAHTYVFSTAIWTPYLAISSAMKRCGKPRLLETISYLVHKPWYTVGASAASLFREIDCIRPTLLLDETDALFKGNKEMAEAVRMILNAGAHHKGTVPRVVGQGTKMTTRNFGVYCPKAFAGIGNLPDTVSDRSLHIRLDRKLCGQGVERLREREIGPSAAELRGRLATWIEKQVPALQNSDPELPDELNDRQQDGAEILLAIADAASGEWPVKARRALMELYTGEAAEDQSVQVRLLADIRAVFDERSEDRLFSADLVGALAEIETSPWSEWRNQQPMTPTQLARELKAFRICPRDIRIGSGKAKGYERQWFSDAWARFLPKELSSISASCALRIETPRQVNNCADETPFLPRDKKLNVSIHEMEESVDCMRVVSDVSGENLGNRAGARFHCYIHGTHTDFWERQGGLLCAKCHPPVSILISGMRAHG